MLVAWQSQSASSFGFFLLHFCKMSLNIQLSILSTPFKSLWSPWSHNKIRHTCYLEYCFFQKLQNSFNNYERFGLKSSVMLEVSMVQKIFFREKPLAFVLCLVIALLCFLALSLKNQVKMFTLLCI